MDLLHLALIATFLPLGTALLLVVLAPLRRSGRPAGLISVASALVALGAALGAFSVVSGGGAGVRVLVDWLPHTWALGAKTQGAFVTHQLTSSNAIQLGVQLDGLSASMLVVVCFVALMVQIFSLGYLADEPKNDLGRYFTWQSLFLFAMNSLVIAPNLLQLFLGWELVGLVSYLLIGYYYKKPSAARAALKAFWVTKFADMGLVAGLIVLFLSTGGFEFDAKPSSVNLVCLLLFVAVMGKSAQFPLHIWLPDAMEGPTPVSALLHAATMVAAGVFLVCRSFPLFAQAHEVQLFMAYLGAFTALFAACVAVVQSDIKKVLAYSTCSQLGYMVAALGAGSLQAGFFHLTTHAFFKALLFLAAGSVIHAVHSNDLHHMGGLMKKMRLTGAVFVVGTLALAGIPPFAGFFSKDLILEVVLEHGLFVPFAALLAAGFLTALYMGRVVVLAFFGEPSEHAAHAHESGPSMALPLVLLAVPAVGLGFFGAELSGLYAEAVHFHLGLVTALATSAGLAGLGTAVWMFGPAKGGQALRAALAPLGRVAASGAVDGLFAFGYRSVLNRAAAGAAWFDRYVVDALVNLSGYASLRLGALLRPMATGKVQDYVYVVAVAALLFGLYGAVGG